MKNCALNVAVVMGMLALPAQAAAESGGWYAALDVGQHRPGEMIVSPGDDDTDIGLGDDWSAFARAGRGIGEHWRVEAEFGYRPGDYAFTYLIDEKDGVVEVTTSGDLDTSSFMGNVIYDFAPSWPVRPFVGLGVGAALFESGADDSTAYAWQGVAGASWSATDNANVDFTYRYFASEVDGVLGADPDYENQSFSVGLRYAF